MLREIGHFLRHAPATLRLKARLPQAELYATLMARSDEAGMRDRRAALAAGLRGEVLELGAGTGAMFGYYEAGAALTAVEPDPAFAAKARDAAAGAPVPVDVVEATGEALPFDAGRFDAGVVALVLCSVPEPAHVLGELHRVLRPGATLRLIEHVRSERRVAGTLMRAVNGAWLRLNGQGCNLDRDPVPAITAAGFELTRVEPFQVFSAGLPAFPMRWIDARRR